MSRVLFWSGLKPAVEDMEDLQAFAQGMTKDRFAACFEDGVIPGLDDELEVVVPNPADHTKVNVKAGGAYIAGDKVVLPEAEDVLLDGVDEEDNIVWIRYDTTESDLRNHYITGEPHACRENDSYELGAEKLSEYLLNPTGKLPLARAKVTGANLVAVDLRVYLRLKKEMLSGVILPGVPTNLNVAVSKPDPDWQEE